MATPPVATPPVPITPIGASQFPSAASILDSVILPALTFARAGVTGIGIPGVEPAINGILELATMLSTTKANKEDLAKLEKSLDKLINIDTTGVDGDLKQRLDSLSSELKEILLECKSLTEKTRFKRFVRSKGYNQRIQDIKNSVASNIHNFTFYGNISIEKCVGTMTSNVRAVGRKIDTVHTNEILAKLKSVPARYNSANTPDKCMDGTRVDIIKDIVTRLSATPNSAERVVMLTEEKGTLAGSFFFSRDYTQRKEITHLPTTLAMHLADYDAEFRGRLIDLLESDQTGILDAEPHLQFQKWWLESLKNYHQVQNPGPSVWML
ncbi:hypothetical protein B0H13DRAFT_2392237 [Mycena leptocephala]|nr:hypothetical protein B0H13DRAFT_2392237 [Mycena leptocephala]